MRALWVAAVAGFCTLVACADASSFTTGSTVSTSVPAPTSTSATLPVATTAPAIVATGPAIVGEAPTDGTIPAALVSGEVVLEEGCVRLRSEFGGTHIVVWPDGTQWVESEQALLLDTGLQIPIGASIKGGGGYYTAAAIGEVMPSIADAVVDCLPAGADATTSDQVVLSFPERLVDPAEPRSVGGIDAPPNVIVRGDSAGLELEAWTFCFANGCADGFPPDPMPSIGVENELEIEFPLEGWTFNAAFQRAGDPCARRQSVDLVATGPTSFVLTPLGKAGTYDVTLFGRGDGDVFVSFEWTTNADGPLPEPEAQIGVLADNDGQVDSYGVELSLTNLATTPTTAVATITVTASNGNSLTFEPVPRPFGPACPTIEGSVSWDGPDDQGLAAAALGPPPFTYDVTVTLDGTVHRALASWPDDQIPDLQPYVALVFEPPLPAVGD